MSDTGAGKLLRTEYSILLCTEYSRWQTPDGRWQAANHSIRWSQTYGVHGWLTFAFVLGEKQSCHYPEAAKSFDDPRQMNLSNGIHSAQFLGSIIACWSRCVSRPTKTSQA